MTMETVIPGKVIPEFSRKTLIITNPEKHTLIGDVETFLAEIKDAFNEQKAEWIEGHNEEIHDLEIAEYKATQEDLIHSKIRHLKEDRHDIKDKIWKIRTSQYKLTICEDIQEIEKYDEYISLPIENEDGVDVGFLYVYGYQIQETPEQ